ncbi:MAG: ATP-binding protein [Leptolyngbyaceae cyanobacterium CAN_BIN12]|nr:ATP-binding protein [Leptolyngbyaceae cyanobacterium CAN_BIN12]
MSNWLKQIVINLLHNAIKFTPSSGQVWVRAKQQGEYVQLEIRDTGVGIASSEIPKIFDRFYRVRQSADDSSGAGLGLTIVQQLLLHCGGSISVKSRVGEGTTFNVLLPVYKSSADLGL